MEKELLEIVKSKELTNEEWQEVVCNLLEIIPENKYNRVNYLLNKNELTEDLTYEEIKEILEQIIIDAEDEKYCENSYYDYQLDEEVVIGDESWIDEIDRVLRGIKGLISKKEYNNVILLYEQVFDITERKIDDLHWLLPGYYHIDEKLESKMLEHYYNYLEAIYYSEGINRYQKFISAFIHHKYELDENIIREFCNKHKEFREKMIEPIVHLLSNERCEMSSIIFNLLMEKNGIDAVMNFLQGNINNNIRVFQQLYKFMIDKEKYKELLEKIHILENINLHSDIRKIIYEKVINVAKIIKDEGLEEKYFYKINEIDPSLEYSLEICKTLANKEKIEQIKQLKDKIVIKEENQEERILIELTLGNIQNMYAIYEKMKNYKKHNVEKIITYYLFKFGSNTSNKKELLTKELMKEIKWIDINIDAKEMLTIMELTKKSISL